MSLNTSDASAPSPTVVAQDVSKQSGSNPGRVMGLINKACGPVLAAGVALGSLVGNVGCAPECEKGEKSEKFVISSTAIGYAECQGGEYVDVVQHCPSGCSLDDDDSSWDNSSSSGGTGSSSGSPDPVDTLPGTHYSRVNVTASDYEYCGDVAVAIKNNPALLQDSLSLTTAESTVGSGLRNINNFDSYVGGQNWRIVSKDGNGINGCTCAPSGNDLVCNTYFGETDIRIKADNGGPLLATFLCEGSCSVSGTTE